MNLDSGTLKLCTLENRAANGFKPVEWLVPVGRYWYAERTVGYSRQYAAKGVNEQVDMLVRTRYDGVARIGMYAVLGNGEQFIITNVSNFQDEETLLRYTDLSLMRLERNYECNTGDR